MDDTSDIAASTRVPGTYTHYNFSRANRTLADGEQKVLIIAQSLPDTDKGQKGTVPALVPVDVFSGDQAATYFGRGSQAHRMAVAAIKANPNIRLTVCALDGSGLGPRTKYYQIAGKATAAGAARLQVSNEVITIPIDKDDTPSTFIKKVAERIPADWPVAASESHADSVTCLALTSRNAGLCGGEIFTALSVSADGLSTIDGGEGFGNSQPDVAKALAAAYSGGHTVIVMPYTDDASLTALSTYLDNVSGPTEQRGVIGVIGWRGTLAGGTSISVKANHKRLTMGWHNGSVLTNGELAAVYAATLVSEDDPSEPLDDMALPGLDVTGQDKWPTRQEEEKALRNGLTPFRVDGQRVRIVRAISTYVKNAAGIADDTLLDITTIRTLDYVRLAWRTRMAQRFKNGGKLTDHRLRQIRSETIDVLCALERLDMVENVEGLKAQVAVTRSRRDSNRAEVAIPASVVRGLHILDATIYLY